MQQDHYEVQAELATADEYSLRIAALSCRDLRNAVENRGVFEHERGDRAAVIYKTASSGYKQDKVVGGRILDIAVGINSATLRLATRDGIRVVREDYELSDTVVCCVNKHGNERVIGSFLSVGMMNETGIALLREDNKAEA
jgi:hypothetical protein